MRLINIHTLEFQEFFDGQIPPYVILSHRWGEGEVAFKQMRDPKKRERLSGPGIEKIYAFCEVVKNREVYDETNARDVDWVWIDTCCIDKRSSSELSEAINSMYNWYRNCVECFVYMRDVQRPIYMPDGQNARAVEFKGNELEAFRNSAWFTRGWTLQELLAPHTVVFFDSTWAVLGYMARYSQFSDQLPDTYGPSLMKTVSDITAIPGNYLTRGIRGACVAEKMSWAANRETSRVEDMAYCLLGLFEINMPLVYGEGTRAFERLQQQIIASSNDQSIFAWAYTGYEYNYMRHSVLARSPVGFIGSGQVTRRPRDTLPDEPDKSTSPAYAITNKGIKMKVDLTRPIGLSQVPAKFIGSLHLSRVMRQPTPNAPNHLYILRLECFDNSSKAPVKILLAEYEPGVYSRMLAQDLGAKFRILEKEDVGMRRIYMSTRSGYYGGEDRMNAINNQIDGIKNLLGEGAECPSSDPSGGTIHFLPSMEHEEPALQRTDAVPRY